MNAEVVQNVGRKDDAGKLRWSLVPMGTMEYVVRVLTNGAKHYADDNWKIVPNARTRYYDAAKRHIGLWWGGEKIDPDHGTPHLAHAICCLLFLLWFDDQK